MTDKLVREADLGQGSPVLSKDNDIFDGAAKAKAHLAQLGNDP